MNQRLSPQETHRPVARVLLLGSSVFQDFALISTSEFQLEGELGTRTCSPLGTRGKELEFQRVVVGQSGLQIVVKLAHFIQVP